MFSDVTETLMLDFSGTPVRARFKKKLYMIFVWGQLSRTMFDDLDLVSKSDVSRNKL